MTNPHLVTKPHKHMMRVQELRVYFNNKHWHKFVCDTCKDYKLVEVGYFR
jgi:hypothetical protein